ncbi:YkgJ family cysteine cluster protein [Vogesella indigofera]|uniref:YkgJ family cysteine cluster protein n=1 Tax=Vogesella indigofera TaxID=45465 RepID=UPI00234F8235|nr:YkgJ family cysteine cluster protein [Vogesella indigofera]MDC7701415.1 YkgJ family cysteine cluster protein [Vogesella indigofera]
MGLKEDQAYAQSNCERQIASFPVRLLKQEAGISDRLEQAKIAPLKKLAAVYELLDDIGSHVAPATPCKKGCSNCCHIAVTVSEIEIQYIEIHAKRKRLKQPLSNSEFHGVPCPFLKSNACSIYSARPFVCRQFHSLAPTAEWCAPEKSFQGKFPLIRSSEAQKAFDALRGGNQIWDIRQIFV